MERSERVLSLLNGVTSVLRVTHSMRPARVYGRPVLIGLMLGLLVSGATPAPAGAQSEDHIKAAFLFNFARYVEWPKGAFENARAPVRICMAGAGDFAGVVAEAVSGKNVGDRDVEVVSGVALEQAGTCHILYVGDGFADGPEAVAASVERAHVFTVADREGFAERGGIANFIRADKKVRFEINPDAAKKAGLKVSSRLLRLAKVVK